MSDMVKSGANIASIKEISKDIFEMWLENKDIASKAKAGQFINVYCNDGSRILPRPISICEIDKNEGKIRIVYRIAGKGTKEISTFKKGDTIDIMGPLGNGFTKEGTKVMLVGGGIGIPPMLQTAKELKEIPSVEEINIVLGYRDNDLFLKEEFEKYGKVYIATDDGSVGTKGNVIDAINENNIEADEILACGPKPMLKGLQDYSNKTGIKTQISLEERMACGIGACLACVCKSKEKDHHTNVNNKRICKDGPVFYAQEVEL